MTEKEVLNIMQQFAALGCTYFSLKDENMKLVLKQKPALDANEVRYIEKPKDSKENKENDNIEIKAPLVGVYYASPSPDETPYVYEGQKVAKGDTIALIEAMKMMNEIKSPVDGIVEKVWVKNEDVVEFDRILMEISKE